MSDKPWWVWYPDGHIDVTSPDGRVLPLYERICWREATYILSKKQSKNTIGFEYKSKTSRFFDTLVSVEAYVDDFSLEDPPFKFYEREPWIQRYPKKDRKYYDCLIDLAILMDKNKRYWVGIKRKIACE